MAGPANVDWFDPLKAAAQRALAKAYEEAATDPLGAAMNALRGMGRGAVQMGDLATKAIPGGTSELESDYNKLLGKSESPIEAGGEFLGPPGKPLIGATILGGRAIERLGLMPKLLEAIKAQRKGMPGAEIWDKYKLEQAPDEQWVTNISDEPARLIESRVEDPTAKLKDVYYHPELYKAEPALGEIKTNTGITKHPEFMLGGFTPEITTSKGTYPAQIDAVQENLSQLLTTLKHEGTHGAAWLQGRKTYGSSPDTIKSWIDEVLSEKGLRHDVDLRVAMRKQATPTYMANLSEMEARVTELLEQLPYLAKLPPSKLMEALPDMKYITPWWDKKTVMSGLRDSLDLQKLLTATSRGEDIVPMLKKPPPTAASIRAPVEPTPEDLQRRIVTETEGLTGEEKYEKLRELARLIESLKSP